MGNMDVQRNFIIGDDWLYFKIYTGTKTSDVLIAGEILRLTEDLLNEGCIDKWFFIRYADPDYHIRLRFHLTQPDHIYQLIHDMNQLISPYLKNGLVASIKVDTYKRELERYGSSSIEQSEDLFLNDSIMVGKALNLLKGDETNDLRWLFGMRAIDRLLSDFHFPVVEKMNLLERLKTSFAHEFRMDKSLRKQLSKKFTINRGRIIDYLAIDCTKLERNTNLFELIDERSIKNILAIKSIMQIGQDLDVSITDLLPSYIHMHCNRLFKSKQRIHEMVMYDLLYQYYKSNMARRKYEQIGVTRKTMIE